MRIPFFITVLISWLFIGCSNSTEESSAKPDKDLVEENSGDDEKIKANNYEVENLLINCYQERKDLKEFNLFLTQLEAELIEKDIMLDDSPRSYDLLLSQLPDAIPNDYVPSGIEKILPIEVDKFMTPCLSALEKLDSSIINQSRFEGMKKVLSELAGAKNYDETSIFKATSDFLTEEDLSHPFYKNLIMFWISTIANAGEEKGISSVPNNKESSRRNTRPKVFVINLDGSGKWLGNKTALDRRVLHDRIRESCASEHFETQFIINPLPGATQKELDECVEFFRDAYEDLRNEKSRVIYQKDYQDLNQSQKEMVVGSCNSYYSYEPIDR